MLLPVEKRCGLLPVWAALSECVQSAVPKMSRPVAASARAMRRDERYACALPFLYALQQQPQPIAAAGYADWLLSQNYGDDACSQLRLRRHQYLQLAKCLKNLV